LDESGSVQLSQSSELPILDLFESKLAIIQVMMLPQANGLHGQLDAAVED
jgi:hypothetical protein